VRFLRFDFDRIDFAMVAGAYNEVYASEMKAYLKNKSVSMLQYLSYADGIVQVAAKHRWWWWVVLGGGGLREKRGERGGRSRWRSDHLEQRDPLIFHPICSTRDVDIAWIC